MIAANYTEFRTSLKKYLDSVELDNETLVIKRGSGDGMVMMSMNEYNSLMETIHLLKSKNNVERLFKSIKQINKKESVVKKLIEN
jgi:antitoxin YefM